MPSPLLQQRLGPGHAFAEALHGVFVVVHPFMDTRYRQAAIINVDELHPVFVQLGRPGLPP